MADDWASWQPTGKSAREAAQTFQQRRQLAAGQHLPAAAVFPGAAASSSSARSASPPPPRRPRSPAPLSASQGPSRQPLPPQVYPGSGPRGALGDSRKRGRSPSPPPRFDGRGAGNGRNGELRSSHGYGERSPPPRSRPSLSREPTREEPLDARSFGGRRRDVMDDEAPRGPRPARDIVREEYPARPRERDDFRRPSAGPSSARREDSSYVDDRDRPRYSDRVPDARRDVRDPRREQTGSPRRAEWSASDTTSSLSKSAGSTRPEGADRVASREPARYQGDSRDAVSAGPRGRASSPRRGIKEEPDATHVSRKEPSERRAAGAPDTTPSTSAQKIREIDEPTSSSREPPATQQQRRATTPPRPAPAQVKPTQVPKPTTESDVVMTAIDDGQHIVVVSGLQPGTSVGDIHYAFSNYGTLAKCQEITAEGDRLLTFEVEYGSKAEAANAVAEMDGVEADGNILKVELVAQHRSTGLKIKKHLDPPLPSPAVRSLVASALPVEKEPPKISTVAAEKLNGGTEHGSTPSSVSSSAHTVIRPASPATAQQAEAKAERSLLSRLAPPPTTKKGKNAKSAATAIPPAEASPKTAKKTNGAASSSAHAPAGLLYPYEDLLLKAGIDSLVTLRKFVRPNTVEEYVKMLARQFPDEDLLKGLTQQWALKERLEEWLTGKDVA